MKCRNCGKDAVWLDDEGICQDCLDSENEDDEEMTGKEMDEFATMIINSPLNPGL
jgi:hypothetical protein